VHRELYKIFYGGFDENLVVRHRCDNRLCVNPEHLLLGTQKENMADASSRGRLRRRCRYGHAFTRANTSYGNNHARICKTCMKERAKKSLAMDKGNEYGTEQEVGRCLL
jgi:hypothetical protein